MLKRWAMNHLETKGANNTLGALSQIILNQKDHTRYTSTRLLRKAANNRIQKANQ